MDYKPIETISYYHNYLDFMRARVSFEGKHNRTKGLILHFLKVANTKALKIVEHPYSYEKRERNPLCPNSYKDRIVTTVTGKRRIIELRNAGTMSALQLYKKMDGFISYSSIRSTLTRMVKYGYIRNYGAVYGLSAQGARYIYACEELGHVARWLSELAKHKRHLRYLKRNQATEKHQAKNNSKKSSKRT